MEDKKQAKWVVDPHGHIVKWPPNVALKDGWRLATDEDMQAAAAIEQARAEAEAKAAAEALAKLREAQDGAAAPVSGGPLKAE